MPAASLPALEQGLVASLIELETLRNNRPSLPSAMAGAEVGQKIDDLLDEIAELWDQIEASPTETLQDATVKLRRLSVSLEEPSPMKLLEGALEAVERAAVYKIDPVSRCTEPAVR